MRKFTCYTSIALFLLSASFAHETRATPKHHDTQLIPPPNSTVATRKDDIHICISEAKTAYSSGQPLDEKSKALLNGKATRGFIRNGLPGVDKNYIPAWSASALIGSPIYGPDGLSDAYVVCLLRRGYLWADAPHGSTTPQSASSSSAAPEPNSTSVQASTALPVVAKVVENEPATPVSNPPSPQKPAASPEITRIYAGFGPQGIAFTPGAVWVAYGNDKDFGVARIDAATSKVVTRIPTGRWPVGAATGEGAVWITNRDGNSVSRVDPDSNRVVATIPVGRKPLGVTFGEGSVWVANTSGNSVSRIDPKTNTVVATIPVGKQASGISVSDGAVWVASYSAHAVFRIDPATNSLSATLKLSGPANNVFATGNDVWVTLQNGTVVRLDAKTNAIVASTPVSEPTGVALADGILWAASWNGGCLYKIDVQSNTLLGRVEVGANPILLGQGNDGNGAIWVSIVSNSIVVKVKP